MKGDNLPMFTKLQWMDIDGGTDNYDYLKVTVAVMDEANERNIVLLETYRFPD